jgi:hypothetical protein
MIEETLISFVKNIEHRTKSHLNELEIILALSTVSRKVNFDEISKVYIEELHDRNVTSILKRMPDFSELTDQQTSVAYFNQAFDISREGFDLLLFFSFFNHYVIMKETKNQRHFNDLISEYDKRYSRLYYKIEDELQNKIKSILTIKSHAGFYKDIGLNSPSVQELNRIMRDAINRSKEKYYHGGIDLTLTVPALNI